ncbi:ABC transporter substrate-binding protein [bacterium]|nr:ABC transporter substrate-binding protein [bacterium]
MKWDILPPNELVFELNSNALFHDGHPVTAQDVIYSFQDAQRAGSPISSLLRSVESYAAISTHKLKIKLKESEILPFLANVVPVIRILPKHYAVKEELFAKHPIGSGPFQFVSSKSRILTLKRNERFLPLPSVKVLKFFTISNPNTRLMSLASGESDLLFNNFPLVHLDKFTQEYNLKTQSVPGARLHYLGINLRHPRLKERALRKALFASINRNELIKNKLDHKARLASSVLPDTNHFFFNPRIKSPEKLASFKSAKSDHQKITLLGLNTPEDRAIMLAIQSYWKEIGVEASITGRDFASFMDSYKRGNFDIVLFNLNIKADPDFLYSLFHSSQFPPERNRFYYQNRQIDELLEQARRATEQGERRKTYAKVQEILMDDLPLLPLWYSDNVMLVREKRAQELKAPENARVFEELF